MFSSVLDVSCGHNNACALRGLHASFPHWYVIIVRVLFLKVNTVGYAFLVSISIHYCMSDAFDYFALVFIPAIIL